MCAPSAHSTGLPPATNAASRRTLSRNAAQIERVAGQQQPRRPVVHGDVRTLMPGDRDDVEHPLPQIELYDVVRPAADPEVRRDLPGGGADDTLELLVPTDVVLVAVRV